MVIFVACCGGSDRGDRGGGDAAVASDLAEPIVCPDHGVDFSDGGSTSPCRPASIDATKCTAGDIASYCSTSSCRSYSEEVSSLPADSCAQPNGTYGVVRVGTCGSLRFIEVQGLGLGYKLLRFYDAQEKLVAAQIASDTTGYCGHSAFAENYGEMPQCCSLITSETICYRSGWIC